MASSLDKMASNLDDDQLSTLKSFTRDRKLLSLRGEKVYIHGSV